MRGWGSSGDCWFVMNIYSPSTTRSSILPVSGSRFGGIFETRSRNLRAQHERRSSCSAGGHACGDDDEVRCGELNRACKINADCCSTLVTPPRISIQKGRTHTTFGDSSTRQYCESLVSELDVAADDEAKGNSPRKSRPRAISEHAINFPHVWLLVLWWRCATCCRVRFTNGPHCEVAGRLIASSSVDRYRNKRLQSEWVVAPCCLSCQEGNCPDASISCSRAWNNCRRTAVCARALQLNRPD